jgi:oligopeptide/dipeptide ABC transporter ATP-binding protein
VSAVADPGLTTQADPGTAILEVEDLTVSFRTSGGWANVVDGVSLSIGRGQALGLVGESGSGKTMTALAVQGLAASKGARVTSSSISLDGHDVSGLSEREWSDIRGRDIGMIFQQPTRSLNPAFTVGHQIAEVVRRHTQQSRKEAWTTAVSMLERVHITNAAQRARDYPHMFSGGMCQRAMIAMALACNPKLLIADEPTTALDVTVQAVVLDVLRELRAELGIAILFITHDLGVIAEMCERVAVMYAGQIVEVGTISDLFERPSHPYSRALIASVPRIGASRRLLSIPGVVPASGTLTDCCRFYPRCAYAQHGRCDVAEPALEPFGSGRDVRCVRAEEIRSGGAR